MNRKAWTLLCITLLLPQIALNIDAKEFRLGYYLGYSQFDHSTLKNLSQELPTIYQPLNLYSGSNFPDYYSHNFFAETFINKKNVIGLNLAYNSTGARYQAADYSGKYNLDFLLSAFSYGIHYRYNSPYYTPSEDMVYYLQVRTGGTASTLHLEESLASISFEYENLKEFRSLSLFIEPSIGVSYKHWKRFTFDISFGYELNTEASFVEKEEKYVLYAPTGDKLKSNWSGFRVRAGVLINLGN